MKRRLFLASALLVPAAGPAFAEKILTRVPRSGASGFTVTTTEDKGMVSFRVVRDTSKARWPGRSGYLQVLGDSGLLVNCEIAPEKRKDTASYRFKVASHLVRGAQFSLWEVQTAGNDPDGEKLLGGGDIFELNLGDFVRRSG